MSTLDVIRALTRVSVESCERIIMMNDESPLQIAKIWFSKVKGLSRKTSMFLAEVDGIISWLLYCMFGKVENWE